MSAEISITPSAGQAFPLPRRAAQGKIVGTMKTVKEVIALLHEQIKSGIEHGFDADPVGNVRLRQLLLMEDCLTAIGFPTKAQHKARVSLVPYIFQEANYDDISWTDQLADLAHLSVYFELDFMVQNQGKERRDVTPQEFEQYCNQSLDFIDRTQAEK
jgi:hypothetical protein